MSNQKPASVEAIKKELTEVWSALQGPLYQGLVMRLVDVDWYLTGVSVGLESLHAFYEITELVYKEHGATSYGARRIGRIRKVYEKLEEFARGDQTPDSRARIMMEMRLALQLLLADSEGAAIAGGRRQKGVVNQLAADINLNLIRLRTFERMRAGLDKLSSVALSILPPLRRREAASFHQEYQAYAADFGFEDAASLTNKATVAEVLRKLERETKNVEANLKRVHQKIYSGRFRDLAGGDPREDLAEAKLVPVLQKIFQAGFEYLGRTHTAYEHGLELVGGDMQALRRLNELSLMLELSTSMG